MNYSNLIVAVVTFAIIGVFHPIVIKAEHHFGTRIWPAFLLVGFCFLVLSFFLHGMGGILSAVIACTCFWSILELFEQKKRVEKGWFPRKAKTIDTIATEMK